MSSGDLNGSARQKAAMQCYIKGNDALAKQNYE